MHNMHYVDAEPETVIKGKYKLSSFKIINLSFSFLDLSRISLNVLITCKKVAEKATLFNFEAVYSQYKKFC